MTLLFVLILPLLLVAGPGSSEEVTGGPSTFGYDASSACSKPYSRTGRMRVDSLPCDFRRQNWCTIAGSSYPWHAVRRFIQENQGLMKRMYGEERHINVIKAEIDKNDVESPDFVSDYQFSSYKSHGEDYDGRKFSGRSYDETKRNGKFPKIGDHVKPHFKLSENAGAKSTSKTTTTPESTTTSTTTTEQATTKTPINETATNRNNTEETTISTPALLSLAQIAKIKNFSSNEIPSQVDRIDEDSTEFLSDETTTEDSIDTDDSTELPTTLRTKDSYNEEVVKISGEEDEEADQTFAASEQEEKFRPRPEYRPGEKKPEMQGQLFQDVAAKDQEQAVLKLRGANACPVKEEIVAPFWANNTRGETLALLNLYPFEQYVHWEKCTQEHKQMYCRDGCRCEQQYTLHRLLAYDPNNECRGIFSDWFSFPSSCICRCYDLPLEFRVTSRSPRSRKHRSKKTRQSHNV